MAKLSPHEVRSISVVAMVDPRSVRKALDHKPLAHLTMQRIAAALAQMGRSDLLATTGASPPQAA